jgi:glycosyltransferase involved in cell wall biosynthesis
MRLTLDGRLEPRTEAEPDERLLPIGELADMIRKPRELASLLWGRRWDSVEVLADDLPPSGVQAGAVGLLALARAKRFATSDRSDASASGTRASGRTAFLARAIATFVVAFPRELLAVRRLLRDARNATARDHALPRAVADPKSVVYLRADPALRWHGHLVGGASTHTSGVINGFAANGLDVDVFAAERPEWTESSRFTQARLERVYHLVFWLTLLEFGNTVARAAESRRPDFIYQRYAMGTYAGIELAERMNVPLVLEYNGSELWIQQNWGSGRAVQFYELALAVENLNLRAASLIVVVSDVLKDQLVNEQGIPAERVLVNPNGVDVDRVAEFRAHDPAYWRRETGLMEAPTVGFVGSFGLWHGVTVLPAMVEELATREPAARWVIIGDGPLHEQVERELAERGMSDRVELTGIVSHDRALALLAASDVCVSPHIPNPDGSRFFGSPTKLFEYMGLAKPIVASDLEQLGEVIDDGRTGVLVPPGDAAAASEAVAKLLSDPKERKRLGEAAFESARTDYSWEAHTRRILEALAR